MNIIKQNNGKLLKLESYWKIKKTDKDKDSLDKQFPYPIEGKFWPEKNQFLERLQKIETFLLNNKSFSKLKKPEKCLLCNSNNSIDSIANGYFLLNNIIWKNSLGHYILKHNIKPSNEFMDFIYNYNFSKQYAKNKDFKLARINGETYMIDNAKYLKINKNQLLILDALMIHGGYNKKYFDTIAKENNNILRFSEHAGLLDFDEKGLDKVIVSAKTSRIDEGDDEIYMPKNMKEAFDYEYMFHTHPPTPTPGGRAKYGILYDFPSISDMLHFIDHFNIGKTQGSIVIASEGLYNIRKLNFDKKQIHINDENQMIEIIRKNHNIIQYNAIKKYNYKFSLDKFYNEIAQDFTYINEYNKILNKFEIHIDYYPRVKDKYGNWYLDTIHLPVMVSESSY